MGAWISTLWSSWFPNREYKLVMVGLDNAGKTTSLYQLSLGQAVVTGPTIGSNVEQVQFENLTFEIWDLGGQANLRPSWNTYYMHTDAVIMVVDSTDTARVGTAKEELFKLLDNNTLSRAPTLVLANKQDLRQAMTVAELTEALNLTSIKNHDWHIQGCCALTGEGLLDGIGWVAQKVNGAKPPPKKEQPATAKAPAPAPAKPKEAAAPAAAAPAAAAGAAGAGAAAAGGAAAEQAAAAAAAQS